MKETRRISKAVWKIVLACGVISTFLLSGCNSFPGLFATITPTITATSTPTSTPTTVPTKTSIPTPTATPLPAWVTGFVQPILSAIADKPLMYQDDFSDPNSGWGYGKRTGGWYRGEYGYQDGEYFIIADPAIAHSPDSNKVTCNIEGGYPSPTSTDFVIEIEGRVIGDGNGVWSINFRKLGQRLEGGGWDNFINYSVYRGVNRYITIVRNDNRNMTDLPDQLNIEVSPAQLTDTDHLQIIAKGPKFAILLNGVPVTFAEDSNSQWFKQGILEMEICNFGEEPLRVQFDNLKIWDISDLP